MQNPTAKYLSNVALLTGCSLLIMAVAAFFATDALGKLELALEDPAQAVDTWLLRKSILSWLVILIADVLVAWGLYEMLKSVNQGLSLLTAWFRLIYVAILAIGIGFLLYGKVVMDTAEAFDAQVLLLQIEGFNESWSFGLIVFGFHLIGLGYLCWRSGFVPKIFGVLILLAALGYLIVHGGLLVIEGFEPYQTTLEMIFMLPMIAGELGLAVWLLIKRKHLPTTSIS